MNIAFIVGKFPSVSETFILNQITGLIDRGHQVDIYAEKPESLTTVHKQIHTYQLLTNTYYFTTVHKNYLKRLLM
ncbi:MAG: colanic acid biosynthesis glycosyltransferase WcaL, partial [Cyanobacteria bacterium P01_E01_bin.35]